MSDGRINAVRVRGNRFVRWSERRLERYAAGRLGSLALGCVRRYGESSENSASALTLEVFLSLVPALLAVYAIADLSRIKDNVIARHLINHLHLHGQTAAVVRGEFGTVAHNAAAASVLGLAAFLVFGLAIGELLEDFYARAWRVNVGSLRDKWRHAAWFVVALTLMGLEVSQEDIVKSLDWVLLIPVWLAVLIAFWLWTPWFLLHRQIELRQLLPGALLVAVTYTVAVTVSQFVVGTWINEDGNHFGAFGVAVSLLTWGQLMGGLALGCAVFSPVYVEWRAGWKRDGASPFRAGEGLVDHPEG
jgi:membrane protein